MHPRVSVVMSVYNGEQYLHPAIESILSQIFTDFELIIIDDASVDRSWEIISEYAIHDDRVKLHQNKKNIGLTKSLNKAIQSVQGEYIARQDADDTSLPERLEKQVAYLDEHHEIGLLGTAYYVIDMHGQRLVMHRQPETDTKIRWQSLFHNTFCHSSVMFRRSLINNNQQFYDESLRYSQDYGLWTRLLKITNAANLQEPLVSFRVHESSIQETLRDEQQRTASNISRKQIESLQAKYKFSLDEINTLRSWYNSFPKRLTKDDFVLCRKLLDLLDIFSMQPNVDHAVLKRIRFIWLKRIFRVLPTNQLKDVWRSGLFKQLIYNAILLII